MDATLSRIKRALRRGPPPPPRRSPAVLEKRARKRAEKQERKAVSAARAEFFAQAAELTPYVAAEIGDEVIFASTRDQGVGRQVFVGRWRKDMTVLERAMEWMRGNGVGFPPDPVLVDVGANIGTTTVMALRRHGFAAAMSIEPSPENVSTLRLNVAINGLEERVHVLPVAASDDEGELALEVSTPNENMGGHHVVTMVSDRTVTVEAVSLDGLVERGVIDPDRVGLVWIDVQGHEAAVVAGASMLVRAGVPMVVAIRQASGDLGPEEARPWIAPPGLRERALESLVSGYTQIVELRKNSKLGRATHPVAELDGLVDAFRHCQDLLFVRRG